MSLLVFNSGNRIAHGLLRNFYKSGKYERIICADIYANYWGIKSFCAFKDSISQIQSPTKLSELKIEEKSDLHHAISQSSHVVYLTHNYYANCSSKLNLIKTTAELVKEQKSHIKKFIAVTPVEYDHYAEADPINAAAVSENEAKHIYPDMVHFKSDLTFGPDSGIVRTLLENMVTGRQFYFKPSGVSPAPIHTDNLAEAVAACLENDVFGEKYIAQGTRRVEWNHLIQVLEKALGRGFSAQMNKSAWESVVAPTSCNLLSELLYTYRYMHFVQFLKGYQAPGTKGAADLKDVKLIDFEDFYKENTLKPEEYKVGTGITNGCIPCILY